jgi:hypothetical protein
MQVRGAEQVGRAALLFLTALSLVGSAVVVSEGVASGSAAVLTSSSAPPHFPLHCSTIITRGQVSIILKRHVTTGRTNDLDPQSSTCFFDTFAAATNDVSVEVDATPFDVKSMSKKYPGHEVATLDGLGQHVAVITGMHVAQVIAIFSTWYMKVSGGTTISTHSYKPSQMLAVAQRAYQNLAHAKHPKA